MGMATLKHLIERLSHEDPKRVVPLGFRHPHSYRGYYEDLAFEPAENVTVGEMLTAARSASGATFQGWKGGDYEMNEWTTVWLAKRGATGETLGPILLDLMLASREGAPR